MNSDYKSDEWLFIATGLQTEKGNVYQISQNHPPKLIMNNIVCPSWSSDNSQIVFVVDGNVIVKDNLSGNEKTIDTHFWRMTQPVWSPLDNYLVLKGIRDTDTIEKIWLINVKTGELDFVNPCADNQLDCSLSAPDWLANNRIIYRS